MLRVCLRLVAVLQGSYCLMHNAVLGCQSCRYSLARRSAVADILETSSMNETGIAAQRLGPFRFSPPMTLSKYRTMQQKRVRLSIRYSGGERYALQTFERIKEIVNSCFPDVVVEKSIREVRSSRDTGKFELVVDDRVVYRKPPERQGVFLSMRALTTAIVRARRLRRPGTVYGDSDWNGNNVYRDQSL